MIEKRLRKAAIISAWLAFLAFGLAQSNRVQKLQKKVKSLENMIKTQGNRIQVQENEIRALKSTSQNQANMMKKLENKYQDVVKRMNTYLQIEPSCSILKTKQPTALSGIFFIKPHGFTTLIPVYCDMTAKNGVGVTVIGHDSESRTSVHGFENPGEYHRKIKYDLSMEHVVAIIKQSRHCEQFIKYECFGSALTYGGTPYGWWVSREGSKMNYWGGAAVNSGKCACGMTNSCARGKKCNCDANDLVRREDSGYLTDKNTLPVKELRFGDAHRDGSTGKREHGYHTLGKLRCWD